MRLGIGGEGKEFINLVCVYSGDIPENSATTILN
jgi:hypothetical protein